MKWIITLFLLALSFSLPAWSQTVTFAGSVSRHAESERSSEVSGTIFFHYGVDYSHIADEPRGNKVAQQFTIPAGVNSVEYQQELEWSLAGSADDSNNHDYFRISIECNSNCELSNVKDSTVWALENGLTGNANERGRDSSDYFRVRIEEFGKDSRESNYEVDLVLLPKYAHITGSVQLSDLQPASEDITIELIGLDYGGCCYWNWAILFGQDLRIPAGQSEVGFDFKIDTDKFSSRSRDDSFKFGYLCESASCQDLQLVEGVFANIDSGQLQSITNRSPIGVEPIGIQMAWSSDSFRLELPQPLKVLKKLDVPIQVSSYKQESAQNDVTGKVIVEKFSNLIGCGDWPTTTEPDFQNDFLCADPSVKTENYIVSETSFRILRGEGSTEVSVQVEPMDQIFGIIPNDNGSRQYPVDIQRIRFVCETGCDSPKLMESGYLRLNTKYSSRGKGGATEFILSNDFLNSDEPLNVSLDFYTDLSGALILLEED